MSLQVLQKTTCETQETIIILSKFSHRKQFFVEFRNNTLLKVKSAGQRGEIVTSITKWDSTTIAHCNFFITMVIRSVLEERFQCKL